MVYDMIVRSLPLRRLGGFQLVFKCQFQSNWYRNVNKILSDVIKNITDNSAIENPNQIEHRFACITQVESIASLDPSWCYFSNKVKYGISWDFWFFSKKSRLILNKTIHTYSTKVTI